MVRWIMFTALFFLCCGSFRCNGGGGEEEDADALDQPVDQDGADSMPDDGDVPFDPAADDASADTPADTPPDTPSDDAGGDEAAGDCVPGPPVTFADGAVYSRDLNVGEGQTYASLQAAAADAGPGDRIVVHPGTYSGGYISNLQGTADQPIAIVPADPGSPPVFSGGETCLQLSDAVYVLIEGIVVQSCSANGINLDDGGDYSTPAGPLVVRGVTIRDVGSAGNEDGLKMSGVDGFVVYGNTIERWGTGGGSAVDMVGCHDGLIAGNTIRHTAGITTNTGVQAKGGCRNVEIRGNLFHNAGGRGVNMGGSTGDPYFRPIGIGYEASDIRVLANVFVGCQAAAAFVGCEDGCLFAHNTVYTPERWFLRILNERPDLVAETRNGRVLYNIVVVDSSLATFLNIGSDTDPGSFTFDGNLWFHLDDAGFTMDTIPNDAGLSIAQTGAVVQQDPLFMDPSSSDFSLQSGSPAAGRAGALAERSVDYEEKCYADPAALGAIEM
jgi:hypothetical protein